MAALLLAVPSVLLSGCNAIKATWKGISVTEMGREGWWKADLTVSRIEAVRRTDRLVIEAGPEAGAFSIRIDPGSLKIPVPPDVIKVIRVDTSVFGSECRVYAVPEGWTWDRVRDWYLRWFDFKTAS